MLKKYVSAVLIVTGISTAAIAQSNVTIYGVLDAGAVNASNSGPGHDTLTGITTGIIGASHLGFLSKEDLGGGLFAGAQLESQINVDDGTNGKSSSTGLPNAVFGREAKVFLDDRTYGKIGLGRQENAAWRTYSSLDPQGHSNIGGNPIYLSDGSSFGGTSTTKVGLNRYTGGTFVNNALRYDSPKFAGFNLVASRIFPGLTTGGVNAGASNQLMLRYDNDDRVFGAAGAFRSYDTTGLAYGMNNYAGIGFRVTDDLTFMTNIWRLENPNGAGLANTKFNLVNIGGRYKINPNLTLGVAYYQLSDLISSKNGSNIKSATLRYNVSKRTEFYTAVSIADNKGTSGFAAWGGGSANNNTMAMSNGIGGAGVDQTAIAVGMRHTF
jgi:predicted porin